MVIVDPGLHVSGRRMCSHMHVEVSRSVQVGDGNDAMHDSFERSEPVVELIVETLGAQPREVCDQKGSSMMGLQPAHLL